MKSRQYMWNSGTSFVTFIQMVSVVVITIAILFAVLTQDVDAAPFAAAPDALKNCQLVELGGIWAANCDNAWYHLVPLDSLEASVAPNFLAPPSP